jgi:release factor glutamine methyltransferase
VTAVDLSSKALEIAQTNHRDVEWLKGDLTQPVKDRKFDLVVCNPPYVSLGEYEVLEPSVRHFEPKMALVGGKSGLEFYERLAAELPLLLAPNAKLFFEIGAGQGKAIKEIFSDDIYHDPVLVPDWAGHDRFYMLKFKENSSRMGSTCYV